MIKYLECSSAGDKRFSALYAKTSFYGIEDTIENIYQSVKRDKYGNKVGKGRRVDHINIKGKCLEPKYLTPLYKMLWVKYLDNNLELVEYAKGFTAFGDKFRGRAINCQADVIRDYVKKGRDSIMKSDEVIEFVRVLRSL